MKNIYSFTNLLEKSGCIHLVTTKNKDYDYNFSLALHTNENPKSILKNRRSIQQQFPNMQFIVANQTHSDHISIITHTTSRGWDNIDTIINSSDALITNQKGVMLTILTADCVPILLFDPKQKVVSAIHSGWKGTKQQITLKVVEKMQKEFNSNPVDIIAGVAPSIGRCCYEVDWGVAQYFQEYNNAFDKIGEKYMLDLPYINKSQLLKAGLQEKNIELSNICTACEVDRYFSYRKENGCSGRFMSMIGMPL